MSAPADEWLLVIDMQRAFADPPSPWASGGFYAALPQVERLVAAYAGRVILTRYVPPEPLTGAWVGYYQAFPSLLLPATDPAWDLTLAVTAAARIETRATFSKWDARMAALVGPAASIAVCGVATECCVLGTVLGAVDDGRRVRVVTDACAGGTPAAHDQTMGILAGFAPLVSLSRTDELLASQPFT
jgi:nicotinamidase-related amidase